MDKTISFHLGVAGYATAGKDVVADVLVEEFGFEKLNMSDALDKYLLILDPYLPEPAYCRYSHLRQRVSYIEAKRNPEVRRLLQMLGTDVGRSIDPDMWVKELEKQKTGHSLYVTTGIRYENEAEMCDFIVEIWRPGVGPLNEHSSEDLNPVLKKAKYVICNDDTLEKLKTSAWVFGKFLRNNVI